LSSFYGAVALLLLSNVSRLPAQDAPPRSLDPRLKVELFAEHPQIVTPTGIDVDSRGCVWAIESNTHFPPENYQGHPTDRVLVMSDSDGDGRADRIVVFTDGLKHTMSVAVRPPWCSPPSQGGAGEGRVNGAATSNAKQKNPGADAPGSPVLSVYLATRGEIRLFHDDDGDDKADRSEPIVHLETKGDYPHNGLAGFAFDPLGWLFFGFGENSGMEYKIIGSDGTTLSGGGEGGNVYRCRLDGSKLERWSTGFWNPHASCFDAFGRLFTVDNDPDSRPPCRLMQMIPGGDYGYRYRNGRKGLHPFSAWNGEIPGTLPMVAGTGEAPSGVLAYESDGFPEEYVGNLFATSWGDHRVDRFRLKPKGTSFTSLAEPVIVGGEDFRPVGIACSPDGSLYFTDWVKRDYTLHRHGRVWRISQVEAKKGKPRLAENVAALGANQKLALLNSVRGDLRRQAARELASSEEGRGRLFGIVADRARAQRERIEAFWALMAIASDAGLDFTRADLFATRDSVAAAAGWLIGSPQLPMDQDSVRKLAEALLVVSPSGGPTSDGKAASSESAKAGTTSGKAGPVSAATDAGVVLSVLSHCRLTPGDPLIPLALSLDDPFVLSIIVSSLARDFSADGLASYLNPGSAAAPRVRIAMLLAARRRDPRSATLAAAGLADDDPDVRRLAVEWAAEENFRDLRPRVEAVFNSNAITSDLFLAALAALEMFDGTNPADIDKTPAAQYVLPLLRDDKRPAAVRAQALRLVSAADPRLDSVLLASFLKGKDPLLVRETVRTLQLAPVDRAGDLLISFVNDRPQDKQLLADALAGLANVAHSERAGAAARKILIGYVKSGDATMRRESLRSLRGLAGDREVREAILTLWRELNLAAHGASQEAYPELADQIVLAAGDSRNLLPERVKSLESKRPATKAQWLAELDRARDADPEAGRRLFYHANGPGCSKCHTVNGRGGHVGPDLSRIADSMDRVRLIHSILEPSAEVAPQYVTWTFETAEGQVLTGMIVHENEGKTIIGDAEGKTTEIKTIEIVGRVAQQKSIMPDKLPDLMTLQEFRDLIAFLESLK
jgi:putative membrane-bound dehydrogenase-like protein